MLQRHAGCMVIGKKFGHVTLTTPIHRTVMLSFLYVSVLKSVQHFSALVLLGVEIINRLLIYKFGHVTLTPCCMCKYFKLSRDVSHAHFDPYNKMCVYVMNVLLCSLHACCML